MQFILQRDHDDGQATLGTFALDCGTFRSLEDTHRNVKVKGRTRIPAGVYEIKLRDVRNDEGDRVGMTAKYADRYPWHMGMLHLQAVPGFTYVYMHTGNTHHHTDGCILGGMIAGTDGGAHCVRRSRESYEIWGKYLTDALMCERVFIDIRNELDGRTV